MATGYSLSYNLEVSGQVTFLFACFGPTTDRAGTFSNGSTGEVPSFVRYSSESCDDSGDGGDVNSFTSEHRTVLIIRVLLLSLIRGVLILVLLVMV